MYTCVECERVFRSKGGLTTHKKTHEVALEVEVVESILEVSESDERRIRKLRDAYKSTFDAVSRNDIENEIKSLGGKLRG